MEFKQFAALLIIYEEKIKNNLPVRFKTEPNESGDFFEITLSRDCFLIWVKRKQPFAPSDVILSSAPFVLKKIHWEKNNWIIEEK